MTTQRSSPADVALDHELLLAEIYAEVDRRRASGELPADLERQLDRAFAEVAPPGAIDDDAMVLERVQRAAFIEPRVPLAQVRQPIRLVKRVLFKLMAWYVHFVTEQVTVLGAAVVAALRSHDGRLRDLEGGGGAVPESLRAELDRCTDPPVPGTLLQAALGAVAGVDGRVLVADSGEGAVLRALRGAGVDAYGAEPRRSRLPRALRDGLEVRSDLAIDHLRALADDRLGALVLVGAAADRSVPATYAELVAEAGRVVAPGGRLVVVSQTPEAWLAGDGGPAADLSPGRPLRPATWAHLLAQAGFAVDEPVVAPPSNALPVLDAATPGAGELNALMTRLGPLVAPAPAYLVSARRHS
jgi:SAM-dependent methyltransferase